MPPCTRISLFSASRRAKSLRAEAFDCTTRFIQNLRKKLVEDGFENILEHGNNNNICARKITGAEEAKIIALACSNAPEGYNRWTVRLLAEKIVELKITESCSHMTVVNTLKKTNLSLI